MNWFLCMQITRGRVDINGDYAAKSPCFESATFQPRSWLIHKDSAFCPNWLWLALTRNDHSLGLSLSLGRAKFWNERRWVKKLGFQRDLNLSPLVMLFVTLPLEPSIILQRISVNQVCKVEGKFKRRSAEGSPHGVLKFKWSLMQYFAPSRWKPHWADLPRVCICTMQEA